MSQPYPTLVPELGVSDITVSRRFYTELLGFEVKFERPAEGFVYLTLQGADIMLDQIREGASWLTAPAEYPLGRGMNLEITLDAVDPLLEHLTKRWYVFLASEASAKQ